MKKHFKTKLVLNSQTIRRLQPGMLDAVAGGRPVNQDSEVRCVSEPCTVNCTVGCRNCG